MTPINKNDLQKQFSQNGYVFLPGFLSEEEVEAIHEHLAAVIREKVPDMPPEHVFYENINDPSSLKQLQVLFKYDPFFYDMMFRSRFEELAQVLLNDRVVGKNMQYFNKPPKMGLPTPPHQDGYYFMLEPNEAVTIWLGLEKVDEENGCVRYVKGSHLKGMRAHGKTGTLGFSQGIADYGTREDLENETWIRTGPGDVLAHHSLTIHRAERNNSEVRTRKALGFIYYAERAKESSDAKRKYQEELTRELTLANRLKQ